VRGPYLVVAPLSTLSNWLREFTRWAPDIPVILYHGSPEVRTAPRSFFSFTVFPVAHQIFAFWQTNTPPTPSSQERSQMRDSILQPDDKLSSFKTVITSYEIIMRDRRQLQVGPW
jgi:ATP-dependent DNA helicase